MRTKHVADDIKHSRVDDQQKKTECKNQERQSQNDQHGSDDRIQSAKKQRCNKQIQRFFIMDASDQINRNQDGQGINQPALQELFQNRSNIGQATVNDKKALNREVGFYYL